MSHLRSNNKEHDIFKTPLWFLKTRHATYYILGIIEVLLAFRFTFKLLGANLNNGFVSFLYSITGIFATPFSGIFNSTISSGLSAKSVFEPGTIIGMIVYAILAWGLVGLVKLKADKEGY
ncbi:MAG: YggT family protein [Clostridiaceae bacterium]|nr:YggT family protein [Clostridiaceae bacterium]